MSQNISEERLERLELIRDNVQKKYGDQHFVKGSETLDPELIPSGALQLDDILGGGWTRGRFHLLWGWEGAGKTTSALLGMANAQRTCSRCYKLIYPEPLLEPGTYERSGHWSWDKVPEVDRDQIKDWRDDRLICVGCGAPYHFDDRPPTKAADYFDDLEGIDRGAYVCRECGSVESVARLALDDEWLRHDGDPTCACGQADRSIAFFCDFEGRLDKRWARALGVDVDAMLYDQPEYGEAGFDVIMDTIQEGVVDFVVIDSMANVESSEALDKSFQEFDVATSARMVNKFLRGLPGTLMHARQEHDHVMPTVVALNQVRHKIGVGFGGGHSLFGGEGQKFSASSIVKYTTRRAEQDEVKMGAKKRKESLGVVESVQLVANCEKNSTAPTEGRECTFDVVTSDHGILKKGEVDDYDLTWKYGRKTGVIDRPEGSNKGWAIMGWPGTFKRKGDMMIDMHHRWWLKMHIQKKIHHRIRNDWADIKDDLSD